MRSINQSISPMTVISHNNVTITLMEYTQNKIYPCPKTCASFSGEYGLCGYNMKMSVSPKPATPFCATEMVVQIVNASDERFSSEYHSWKMIDTEGYVFEGFSLCDDLISLVSRRIKSGDTLLPHTQSKIILVFPELEEGIGISAFVCNGGRTSFRFNIEELSATAQKALEKPPTVESKTEDKNRAYTNTDSFQRLQDALTMRSAPYTDAQYCAIFENLARNYYMYVGNDRNLWEDGKTLLEHYPYVVSVSEVVGCVAAQKNIFVVLTRNSDAVKAIIEKHGIRFDSVDAMVKKNAVTFITFFSEYASTEEMREVGLNNAGRIIFSEIESNGDIKCGYYCITWSDSDKYTGRLSGMRELGMNVKVRESNSGVREDLGTYFRSSWEANIARIFNETGVAWEYEKEPVTLSVGGYTPDFVLPNDTILEVKGYWDADSLKKVLAFHKEIPEQRLLIVDSDTVCG